MMKFNMRFVKDTKTTYRYEQVDGEQIGSIYIKKYCYPNDRRPDVIRVIIE